MSFFSDESQALDGKIGGPGVVVEVDETKIGKRKFHRGRVVDGQWIFGMVERNGGELRLEGCQDNKRDKKTLLELLNKHVSKGSVIMSDCWKGYAGLEEEGFQHFTVNHSEHFVDPETGAHTQTIESNWRALKRRLSRGGVRQKDLGLHFAEHLWFKIHKADPFKRMLIEIKTYA